jgi:penicillin amidase
MPWCDDRTTPALESCAVIVAAALDEALAWIADETGGAALDARWGELHRVRLRHDLFRFVPVVAGLTGLSAPTDGGRFTLGRGVYAGLEASRPFAHGHGAGLRAVIALGEPGGDGADTDTRGHYVIASGQSGNPLSAHYADQFDPWRRGVLVRIGEPPATGTLRLTP